MDSFDSQAAEVAVPGTDWETGPARGQLEREIAAHVQAERLDAVGAALAAAQKAVASTVSAGAMPLLDAPPPDLWPRLAKLLERAVCKVSTLAGKDLNEVHDRI